MTPVVTLLLFICANLVQARNHYPLTPDELRNVTFDPEVMTPEQMRRALNLEFSRILNFGVNENIFSKMVAGNSFVNRRLPLFPLNV